MKNFKKSVLAVMLTSVSFVSFSQASLRLSREKFINEKGDTLQYRFLFPDYDTLQKYPLVIFLHGSGERGHDNELQLKWGVMNFASDEMMARHPAFVIAPQCPGNQQWSNYTQKNRDIRLEKNQSKPMELLIGLINKLTKDFRVDKNRIYITGLSMGAYGTYDAIERYPDLFAAAVPVCGGGDVSKASTIARMPIWIFHGAEDSGISPLYSLDMLEALTKAGAHPGYTQYPATGHFAWLGAYTDQLMIEWLFRQHK